MAKIYAGYVRVSTDMQVERDSLINQEEVIKSFARAKNKEVRIYKDAGISAKDTERPAFKDLLGDIEKGLIEAVVATKLDRITRSLKDLIYLKELFKKHEVSFISITEYLDTSTPMGKFSFHILGSVAQLEREVTAERVAGDMRNRAKRKKWNGGVAPYGFTSQARHYRDWFRDRASEQLKHSKGRSLKEIIQSLEQDSRMKREALTFASQRMPESKVLGIDPDEADTVKKIYSLYLNRKSFRGVVHALNSLGIKTREGQSWASTSVHRILQNPVYYGALAYNRRRSSGKTSKPRPKDEHIIVEDAFSPIIPKDQFFEVQKIIAEQRKIPSYSKHSQYLMSGLLECQLCGTKMYGYSQDGGTENDHVYRYYRCNGHISKGPAFCPGNTVDARLIEGIVLEELKSLSTCPERLKERMGELQSKFDDGIKPLLDQQKALQLSLTKLEKKGQRLLGLYEDELIEKEEFKREKDSLDSERAFMEQELREINGKLFSNDLVNFDPQATLSSIHNLGEVFDELDFRERKELLRTVINKIEVGKHYIDCQIFAPPKSIVAYDRMVRDSLQQRA